MVIRGGQSLVEILLAVGVAAILIPAVFMGLAASREGKAQQEQRVEAVAWAQEGAEAVRSIRVAGWAGVATSGTFHPVAANGKWTLAAGNETTNGYTRSVTIQDVYRDANGNLAQTGYLDPSTKKIIVAVSWSTPVARAVSQELYLTRYKDNLAHLETTQADFNAGTKSNTFVTNTSGGEVVLGAGGGGGDWCIPSLSITTVDLSRQGVPTAISAYQGNIVTGTGGNASGPTFVKTLVLGNNPPITTIAGQFNNSKANGVFTETIYGYIATTDHAQEVKILDLTQFSNPPANTLFQQVGYFNAPGNGDGDSVYAAGNVGYMTSGNKFYTFNLDSHSGSRAQLNPTAVTLAGTGKKVIVAGAYAYVAVNSTTTQLQVINVANPTAPIISASAQTGNNQPGIDVAINATGTRAYVVTGYAGSGSPDFFVVNTTNKSGVLPLVGAGFNTQGMNPKGVAVVTGNRALIGGTGGTTQYQVVNLANEAAPVSCGTGLAISGGVNAVAGVLQDDGYAYSYIVTGDASAELKIILGGAGGQYTAAGTYESTVFDAGYETVFNRLSFLGQVPGLTELKFQVAIADAVGGGCSGATFSFIGPDKTNMTYFTGVNNTLPFDDNGVGWENPGRCFKYKAFLSTGDQFSTPVVTDMIVNYSP